MFRAIWSLLVREDGQAIFLVGALAEVLLMVLLGLALTLQRLVLDRIHVDEALLSASQSACRQISLPIGPTGPVIDASRAASTFSTILDENLPSSEAQNVSSSIQVVPLGSQDPHTGYVFRAEGVETSVRYTEIFLGHPLTQVLYMDAEVHHDLA